MIDWEKKVGTKRIQPGGCWLCSRRVTEDGSVFVRPSAQQDVLACACMHGFLHVCDMCAERVDYTLLRDTEKRWQHLDNVELEEEERVCRLLKQSPNPESCLVKPLFGRILAELPETLA